MFLNSLISRTQFSKAVIKGRRPGVPLGLTPGFRTYHHSLYISFLFLYVFSFLTQQNCFSYQYLIHVNVCYVITVMRIDWEKTGFVCLDMLS